MFTFALAPTLGKAEDDELAKYQPLAAFLQSKMKIPVSIVRFSSYAHTIDALRAGRADAASLGLRASEEAQKDGSIEPMLMQRGINVPTTTYRSVFVTRTDSNIISLEELRNRQIGLVDGQSTSGYVMPRAMLREANIDPDNVQTSILDSHRAVVEAVIDGSVAAGAVHESYLNPPDAERAMDYARLRVVSRSREIPRGPIVVRSSLEPATKRALRDALLAVHDEDNAAARLLLTDGHQFTASGSRVTPTLKSIAALAGVSYATVSRVVNNSGYVSEALRKRIESIVEEVGYAPNGNARVLLGLQLPIVAIAVRLDDSDSLRLIESLRPKFENAELPLLLIPVGESLESSLVSQILRDRRLGALVVLERHVQDPLVRSLASSGLPVVAVSSSDVPPGVARSTSETLLADVLRMVSGSQN